MSYNVDAPILVGDTEVIHGTSSLSDVSAWPGVLTGSYYGSLWERAASLAEHTHPSAFVGHSLGATYAKELAARRGKDYRGYGRPGFGEMQPGDIANAYDPVSVLLHGGKRNRLGHSMSSYT